MRKKLEELTIKDNFMFGAVMTEPENCKGLLEMVLEKPIGKVVVSKEKSMVYHPEYKGVRLDVYAKDEENTHYNVEMQVVKKPALGRRSRYYQSQLDMELLLGGQNYGDLPDTYVIFICDFDPFGEKKYRYRFQTRCADSDTCELDDGRRILFLSTCGENEREIPKELRAFLRFVKASRAESEEDFQDDYVKQLQQAVRRVKESREMEGRHMIWKEMLEDEYAEGKREGLQEGLREGKREGLQEGKREGLQEGKVESARTSVLAVLEDMGEIPPAVKGKILEEKDLDVLLSWVKLAAKSESVEEFTDKIAEK